MKELFTEIADYAEQIKAKAEKASDEEDRDREEWESALRTQVAEQEQHFTTRFELLVEKIDDFERGLITLGELKEAAR